MRTLALISLLTTCSLYGQVTLDGPLRAVGAQEQRGIDGVALPDDPSSALTVEASLLGVAHWAAAVVVDSLITLLQEPGVDAYRPGMMFRFLAPADQHGELLLRVGELDDLPLLRPDGIPPAMGQLKQGRVAEVLFATDRWVLTSAAERGCPMGTLQVQENLCIQIEDIPDMNFYVAMDHCAALGGKLCTRDEYFLACSLFGGQLLGLFDNWEWIDDTANHDHTGDQVAITDCFAHRSANMTSQLGDTRCCFHPR